MCRSHMRGQGQTNARHGHSRSPGTADTVAAPDATDTATAPGIANTAAPPGGACEDNAHDRLGVGRRRDCRERHRNSTAETVTQTTDGLRRAAMKDRMPMMM
ncbi:hypothetical protein JCM18882A_02370 [Brevibacterium metallidurans]|uniref:Uncharacterized protein n=1 Tax=Brevibacterium metallidurans TaxID=1482676 RepID=A0ABN0SJ57_9MICO